MAIEITPRNAQGVMFGRWEEKTAERAANWMHDQARTSFVDGFTVGGFGIVRVTRTYARDRLVGIVFTWLDGDSFASGDADDLALAIAR